jgi:hypothetical protein
MITASVASSLQMHSYKKESGGKFSDSLAAWPAIRSPSYSEPNRAVVKGKTSRNTAGGGCVGYCRQKQIKGRPLTSHTRELSAHL